jgi:hypothetical protein
MANNRQKNHCVATSQSKFKTVKNTNQRGQCGHKRCLQGDYHLNCPKEILKGVY